MNTEDSTKLTFMLETPNGVSFKSVTDEDMCLNDIPNVFLEFLRGCGYYVDGVTISVDDFREYHSER